MPASTRYGITIRLDVQSFPHCCGAKIMHQFRVSGNTRTLTLEQKHKMYDELFRKCAGETQGMLIAADCVLDFGEWADLRRSGGGGDTSWTQAAGAGDISLEDFCKHHKFDVTAYAKNNNSGNIVATFSKAVYSVAPDADETVTKYFPEMPDFSDEPSSVNSAGSTDVAAVLAQLREAVRRAA